MVSRNSSTSISRHRGGSDSSHQPHHDGVVVTVAGFSIPASTPRIQSIAAAHDHDDELRKQQQQQSDSLEPKQQQQPQQQQQAALEQAREPPVPPPGLDPICYDLVVLPAVDDDDDDNTQYHKPRRRNHKTNTTAMTSSSRKRRFSLLFQRGERSRFSSGSTANQPSLSSRSASELLVASEPDLAQQQQKQKQKQRAAESPSSSSSSSPLASASREHRTATTTVHNSTTTTTTTTTVTTSKQRLSYGNGHRLMILESVRRGPALFMQRIVSRSASRQQAFVSGGGELRDGPAGSSSSSSLSSSSSNSATSGGGGGGDGVAAAAAESSSSLMTATAAVPPDMHPTTAGTTTNNIVAAISKHPTPGCDCDAPTSKNHPTEQDDGVVVTATCSPITRARSSGPAISTPTCTSTATAILQHSYLDLFCGSTASGSNHHDSNGETEMVEDAVDHKSNTFRGGRRRCDLPEDPTVQESIECVFASQLEEEELMSSLLDTVDDDGDDDDEGGEVHEGERLQIVGRRSARHRHYKDHAYHHDKQLRPTTSLVAPSVFQQSLFKHRSDTKLQPPPIPRPPSPNHKSTPPSALKERVHAKLVHVGTFDPCYIMEEFQQQEEGLTTLSPTSPSGNNNTNSIMHPAVPIETSDAVLQGRADVRCQCHTRRCPVTDPVRWPQRPLLLRPTPGSGTRIKGIRFSSSRQYLWQASHSNLTWPAALRRHWGLGNAEDVVANQVEVNPMDVMCAECMICPINSGNEPAGECLVTDFESDLFEGTLLVRIRYTTGTMCQPEYDDNVGYFTGMNRRYQTVIRGRFKQRLPWTSCVTGFELKRRCGKLPPKWMVKGAVKVVSFFAPQLQVCLDGPCPRSISPLGSTPQSLIVQKHLGTEQQQQQQQQPLSHNKKDENDHTDHAEHHDDNDGDNAVAAFDMEQLLEEPVDASQTLLGRACDASSTLQRARYRKKAFDRLFAVRNPDPMTDPHQTVTLEFLQHLLDFQTFSIELGPLLGGSVGLKDVLDGQPLQIMAAVNCATEQQQHQQQYQRLWSFDLWHESLVEDAKRHDVQEQASSSSSSVLLSSSIAASKTTTTIHDPMEAK